MLDLASCKPFLSALVLPPVPLMGWLLAGALMARKHPRTGMGLSLTGLVLLWLSCSLAPAVLIQNWLLRPPAALSLAALHTLSQSSTEEHPIAIVMLGGGRDPMASDYGQANLSEVSMTRLRYGVWLARHSYLPMAYSGGVGWAQAGNTSEAVIADRILREEYGLEPRWLEPRSRDTEENARLTVPLLMADGVQHIILVTHALHMPRALRQFETAAAGQLQITPAPVSELSLDDIPLLNWMPSGSGMKAMHAALHELIGLWVTT